MITIEENKSKKLPGGTSLFITFNYNDEIIKAIKSSCDIYNYDKKLKTWEAPTINLSKLLDNLCSIDEIVLKLLKDKKEKESNNKITTKLKTKPYEYQREGIEYGINHDKFLLLDAPGLGKSLQVIYTANM